MLNKSDILFAKILKKNLVISQLYVPEKISVFHWSRLYYHVTSYLHTLGRFGHALHRCLASIFFIFIFYFFLFLCAE